MGTRINKVFQQLRQFPVTRKLPHNQIEVAVLKQETHKVAQTESSPPTSRSPQLPTLEANPRSIFSAFSIPKIKKFMVGLPQLEANPPQLEANPRSIFSAFSIPKIKKFMVGLPQPLNQPLLRETHPTHRNPPEGPLPRHY
jgi:hypothetical protein